MGLGAAILKLLGGASSANPIEPASGAPPPRAVPAPDLEAGAAQSVPRYPDPGLAVPAVAARDLVASQATLVNQIVQTLGLEATRQALLDPVLERYAAYVHLLPASETHHHCGIGGMLRHSLEVAFYAARYTEGVVFGMDLPPERRHPFAERARLVTTYAGLLHDAGKPLVDIGAMDPVSGELWNPHVAPLADWLTTRGLDRYTLFWHPGARHRRHEAFAAALVHQILGREVMQYIAQGDARGLIDVLFMAISNSPDLNHPIADAVKRADAASVERDLKRQNTMATQAAGGAVRSLAVRIVHAMQVLLREGRWKPNTPGSPVWVTDQGVFLSYPDSMMSVIEHIRAEGRTTIPAHPEVLLAALREARYVVPHEEQGTSGDTWPLTLRLTTGKVERLVTLRALKVDRPEVLFGNEPLPSPVPVFAAQEQPEPPPATPSAPPEPAPTATPQAQAAPPPAAAASEAPAQAPAEEATGACEPPPPSTRNRRNGVDVAEQRAAARAKGARDEPEPAPDTPQAALEWLAQHAPLGEFIKAFAMRKQALELIAREADHLVAAFPEAFAGIGVPVERIAKLLMDKHWVVPDAVTPDRATVMVNIAGTQRLALRFTVQLSNVLLQLIDTPADVTRPARTKCAAPGGTVQPLPPPPPERQDSPREATPPAPTRAAAPGEAQRKIEFYQFLRAVAPKRAFIEITPEEVERSLARFAREQAAATQDLIGQLSASPNPLLSADGTRLVMGFRYDKARAAAKQEAASDS